MSEMVERVGEALRVKLIEWYDGGIGFEDGGLMLARAAIEEMREPTEGMIEAGLKHQVHTVENSRASTFVRWSWMVDAALGDMLNG